MLINFFTAELAGEDQVAEHSQEGIGGLEQMGQGLTCEIKKKIPSVMEVAPRYTLLRLLTLFPILNCLTLLELKHIYPYVQGGSFYWSALKMTNCQTLREF